MLRDISSNKEMIENLIIVFMNLRILPRLCAYSMLNRKGMSKPAINTYEQLCEIYLRVNRFNIIVGGSKSIFILLIFLLHLYNGLNRILTNRYTNQKTDMRALF